MLWLIFNEPLVYWGQASKRHIWSTGVGIKSVVRLRCPSEESQSRAVQRIYLDILSQKTYDQPGICFRFQHVTAHGCPHVRFVELYWTSDTAAATHRQLKWFRLQAFHSNWSFCSCRQLQFYFIEMLFSGWSWKTAVDAARRLQP